jgi:hypothetical protein
MTGDKRATNNAKKKITATLALRWKGENRTWRVSACSDTKIIIIEFTDTLNNEFQELFSDDSLINKNIIKYLTNFMEESPSREAASGSVTQQFPCILWNSTVHSRVHKSSPLGHIMGQLIPIPITP